ncbi:MAG: metal-dependent hydrolase [Bacteroidota bacterium]
MDSLTQIVLGAAVGEAVLGKKVGNKAVLYGAIAGTLPDLDVLVTNFTDTTTALAIHQGFTHSIVFSVVFGLLFGWLVSRYEKYKNPKGWIRLFFWALITHPLLDAHTTWGTQLFWPFEIRLAFQSIFVIDPLYTLPFLVFLILAMVRKRTNPKRRFFNTLGLGISSFYLAATLVLKGFAYVQFKDALESQNISYTDIDIRPAPMNTILWSANVDTGDTYLLGTFSFLDTQPISFEAYPKDHLLLGDLIENERIQRMIRISKGWFIITQKEETLYFNDLRFGLLTLEPGSTDFVFQYKISENALGEIELTEVKKTQRDGKKLLAELWERVRGN